MEHPITKRAFELAYDSAMPEHGEGWDCFARVLESEMEKLENQLAATDTQEQRIIDIESITNAVMVKRVITL